MKEPFTLTLVVKYNQEDGLAQALEDARSVVEAGRCGGIVDKAEFEVPSVSKGYKEDLSK
jgi:hypothetical protein